MFRIPVRCHIEFVTEVAKYSHAEVNQEENKSVKKKLRDKEIWQTNYSKSHKLGN